MRATIVFYASTSPISQAIRWLTHSRTSHAAIGTAEHGVRVLFHCSVGGPQVTNRRLFERSDRQVAEFVLPDFDESMLRRAELEMGLNYSYAKLLWLAFAILAWRWLRLKVRRPRSTPRSMVCSEFVCRLGHPLFSHLDPETATPEDLLRICIRAGLQFVPAAGDGAVGALA